MKKNILFNVFRTPRFFVVSLVVFLVALSRVVPHLPNYSPLIAMTLFGSCFFQKKWQAFGLPILATWVSDLVLNNIVYTQYFPEFTWFYKGFYFQYGTYVLVAFLGHLFLKRITVYRVVGVTFSSSLLFFLISNFGVWMGSFYPQTWMGLYACYVAGIPFFKNAVLGDMVYAFSLIYGVLILEKKPYFSSFFSTEVKQTLS